MCLAKSRLSLLQLALLGVLAGTFIGLGALFSVLVLATSPSLGFAASRLLGGAVFSLGLLLVVVAGAEAVHRQQSAGDGAQRPREHARCSQELGSGLRRQFRRGGRACGGGLPLRSSVDEWWRGRRDLHRHCRRKSSLSFTEAFFRGVLCNVLVCMAVWMTLAGRSVVDKFIVILVPVTAFVAAGFEHSIANMHLYPLAGYAQGGQRAAGGVRLAVAQPRCR